MLVSTLPAGVIWYLVVAIPVSLWQVWQFISVETGAVTVVLASSSPVPESVTVTTQS
jgi:hypothetical protein